MSLPEALARFAHERELLLVLDNFEHLLDAAPELQKLVLGARSLKAITSSRAPLRVSGEVEYPIPELDDDDASALFSERARAIRPDFELNGDAATVGEICRRLDHLPLAIELAAARTKVLSPGSLLERLERRLPVLTAGVRDLPDRQRTLRDTIAWSYDLLEEPEQHLFAKLAVFEGGFTLAAAERVCDADLDAIASLVEYSLIRQDTDRFVMLETIREYAGELLEESGQVDRARRDHSAYFLEFADPGRSVAERRSPPVLELLASEQDNLRAALRFAQGLEDPGLASRLAAALGDFWELRGYLTEGLEEIRVALEGDPQAPAAVRGELLAVGGMIATKQGDYETALSMTHALEGLYAS